MSRILLGSQPIPTSRAIWFKLEDTEEWKKWKWKNYRKLNYPYLHSSGVPWRAPFACGCRLVDYSQLPWSVPGSEMSGSAKLRKRDHENKTGENCGATSPLYLDHTLVFSPVMLKRRPCRLQTVQTVQTVQTECYFFYLYLNFLVKFFAVAIWPVTGQGFQNAFAVHSMAKNRYWKLDIISLHQRKVKITFYKKALLFDHTTSTR